MNLQEQKEYLNDLKEIENYKRWLQKNIKGLQEMMRAFDDNKDLKKEIKNIIKISKKKIEQINKGLFK